MKSYIIGLFLLVVLLLMVSCQTQKQVVENDDLYFSKRNRDSVIVKYRDRYIFTRSFTRSFTHSPASYSYPYGGWYGTGYSYGYRYDWYRPNVIIIKPEYRIEKRPDREGNGGVSVPLNRRRGRN